MKARFRLGALEIEVEGDTEEVSALAQSLAKRATNALALNPAPIQEPDAADPVAEGLPDDGLSDGTDHRLPDARHFFSQHSPTNNREATAVAAYYAKHVAPTSERSPVLSKETLEAIFREAKWKLPKRPDQTLVDAASTGYLKRVEAGRYELTNVGHNLVMHTLGPSASAD